MTFLVQALSVQGDCKVVKKRVCNGQVHKVRNDGTKITCSNGKFTAVKGRKGKAAEEEETQDDPQLNCEWYGQTFCVGDVIIDLYRWWFKVRYVQCKCM